MNIKVSINKESIWMEAGILKNAKTSESHLIMCSKKIRILSLPDNCK
jgi:hypothetical protein